MVFLPNRMFLDSFSPSSDYRTEFDEVIELSTLGTLTTSNSSVSPSLYSS